MHRHNIGDSHQGEFQVITKVPFKDLLRNYFGTQDLELELMTFVTNENYLVKNPSNQMQFEYPSARVLDDAFSVEVTADKGKKTLIWIAPRPGTDKGKLSDSILDLIVLSCCPDGLKQHLAPEKSKYYLVASWTTSLKTGRYCEPVWTDENIPEMKEYTNKLVKMPLRYSDGLLKDTKINFYIPPVLIQNRFGTNPIEMGHGRRLEQDLLVSKGYITSDGEPTSLAREIVSQLQNFIFLEWWRGYFVIKRDLREPIENLIEKYPQVPEIIRLKAYLDVETARHPLNFEITLDEMSVELMIEKERIRENIQQFIVGDNPGSYCLSETTFFFPPRVTKKIARDWRKIKKELKSTFTCVGRKAKINEILSFVNSDRNILLIHGPEGAGKTRILVECAQLSEEIWNWYWVSPDTTIKWDVLFTELARESRKTILVFDNLMFYKDWNAFLLNAFEGLDYSKLQLKIVFVVWEPWIASFIQQKYLLHGSSSFQEIEILPLVLTPEIREALKEQLTTQGIPIEFVDIIINNSDGYPDKMQEIIEGLKFFPTGRGGSEVSQFDQRMTLLWNDPPAINIPSEFSSFLLDQKERDFLFFLSLVKTWRVNVENRSIFTGVDRYDISIVESLIKKDWVLFSDGTIRWKRDAKRKWVFEYNTLKSGKKRTSLESYLRVYVKEDPSIYATIIETLGDRITYKDTIMILEQIDGWGELSTLSRFKQEIEALQKLCILFCRKYFENLYVMENDPTSAKKYTDSSLYDDVPSKFKQLVKKEVGVVREMLSREKFKDISHHCFLLIHILNAAGEFLQSEQLLGIITSLRDPVDESFFLLKIELLIYYRHDWENCKNYVEILSKENKLSLIGKAQAKFFLAHEHVMVQGEFTKSDVDLILESSSLYEELNAREKFIALWSRMLSTFLNCKIKKQDLELFMPKIQVALRWSEEVFTETREYMGLRINIALLQKFIPETQSFSLRETHVFLEHAISRGIKEEAWYLVGDAYHAQGDLYLKFNEYGKAIDSLEKAIEFTKRSLVYTRISNSYLRLGDAYWHVGKLIEAKEAFTQALIHDKKENQTRQMLDDLLSLFDLSFVLDQKKLAADYIEEMKILLPRITDKPWKTDALFRICEGYLLLNDTGKALDYFEKISLKGLVSTSQTHYMLLKAFFCIKSGENGDFSTTLDDYTKLLVNYDIEENNFEFLWIFRLLEILPTQLNQSTCKEIAMALRDNEILQSHELSAYEVVLLAIDTWFRKNNNKEPKSWMRLLLRALERPASLQFLPNYFLESLIFTQEREQEGQQVITQSTLDNLSRIEAFITNEQYDMAFIFLCNIISKKVPDAEIPRVNSCLLKILERFDEIRNKDPINRHFSEPVLFFIVEYAKKLLVYKMNDIGRAIIDKISTLSSIQLSNELQFTLFQAKVEIAFDDKNYDQVEDLFSGMISLFAKRESNERKFALKVAKLENLFLHLPTEQITKDRLERLNHDMAELNQECTSMPARLKQDYEELRIYHALVNRDFQGAIKYWKEFKNNYEKEVSPRDISNINITILRFFYLRGEGKLEILGIIPLDLVLNCIETLEAEDVRKSYDLVFFEETLMVAGECIMLYLRKGSRVTLEKHHLIERCYVLSEKATDPEVQKTFHNEYFTSFLQMIRKTDSSAKLESKDEKIGLVDNIEEIFEETARFFESVKAPELKIEVMMFLFSLLQIKTASERKLVLEYSVVSYILDCLRTMDTINLDRIEPLKQGMEQLFGNIAKDKAIIYAKVWFLYLKSMVIMDLYNAGKFFTNEPDILDWFDSITILTKETLPEKIELALWFFVLFDFQFWIRRIYEHWSYALYFETFQEISKSLMEKKGWKHYLGLFWGSIVGICTDDFMKLNEQKEFAANALKTSENVPDFLKKLINDDIDTLTFYQPEKANDKTYFKLLVAMGKTDIKLFENSLAGLINTYTTQAMLYFNLGEEESMRNAISEATTRIKSMPDSEEKRSLVQDLYAVQGQYYAMKNDYETLYEISSKILGQNTFRPDNDTRSVLYSTLASMYLEKKDWKKELGTSMARFISKVKMQDKGVSTFGYFVSHLVLNFIFELKKVSKNGIIIEGIQELKETFLSQIDDRKQKTNLDYYFDSYLIIYPLIEDNKDNFLALLEKALKQRDYFNAEIFIACLVKTLYLIPREKRLEINEKLVPTILDLIKRNYDVSEQAFHIKRSLLVEPDYWFSGRATKSPYYVYFYLLHKSGMNVKVS